MSIPKYVDWQNRYKIFSQNWPISTKVARESISDDIKNYEAATTATAKRIVAKSMLEHVDAFEKLWKRDSIYPIPKEIAELRAGAQIVSGVAVSSHKYDYACCIAYKVGTSKFDQNIWVQENTNGAYWYHGRLVQYEGELEDEADRVLRCSWMKAAINQAYSSYRAKHLNDPIDAKTLKVFMAPEFFFRGNDGAYDISFFPTIVNEMRGLTKDTKFKDWLFVLGTVITATFAGDVYLQCTQCGEWVVWGDRAQYKAKGFTYQGMDAKGKQDFRCAGKSTHASMPIPCMKGSVKEFPQHVIIDNMALVMKGGENDDHNFRYVQKETISAIDFRRVVNQGHFDRGLAVTNYTNTALFEDDWGSLAGRKIEVKGHAVTALPSPGAQDVSIPYFDQRLTDSKDESKSGGSLFTIDGIKFGLEICVDHTNGRRLQPTEGVQIQLVPSAGAHIAHFVCRPGGIAFNVDGGAAGGSCNVLINTTGSPQTSGAPSHTSGGAPEGGQAGTEIILYEPSPIPWV